MEFKFGDVAGFRIFLFLFFSFSNLILVFFFFFFEVKGLFQYNENQTKSV